MTSTEPNLSDKTDVLALVAAATVTQAMRVRNLDRDAAVRFVAAETDGTPEFVDALLVRAAMIMRDGA